MTSWKTWAASKQTMTDRNEDRNEDDPAATPDPEFERRILAALELPAPALSMPDLPAIESDNVESDNVTVLPTKKRIGAPVWLALAATVVVAAMLGVRLFDASVTYPSLADEIVAHLEHEPHALRPTDKPVSDRRLARVVDSAVAEFDRERSLITYANTCTINGKAVPHLVIQGERGPVTIILMPDEKIDGAQSLAGRNVNGVILPVGSGSIAIIGEAGERLERIEQDVVSSVTWIGT